MLEVPYLADTNFLIRLVKRDHSEYPMVRKAVDFLDSKDIGLAYTFQNMTEFWNALTRPVARNGFGLPIEDCANDAKQIEGAFLRLTDTEAVYTEWRRLVLKHRVTGVQVHDARLAASMYAHGLTRILTFNVADFARFDGIIAVHPDSVERQFSPLPTHPS